MAGSNREMSGLIFSWRTSRTGILKVVKKSCSRKRNWQVRFLLNWIEVVDCGCRVKGRAGRGECKKNTGRDFDSVVRA